MEHWFPSRTHRFVLAGDVIRQKQSRDVGGAFCAQRLVPILALNPAQKPAVLGRKGHPKPWRVVRVFLGRSWPPRSGRAMGEGLKPRRRPRRAMWCRRIRQQCYMSGSSRNGRASGSFESKPNILGPRTSSSRPRYGTRF